MKKTIMSMLLMLAIVVLLTSCGNHIFDSKSNLILTPKPLFEGDTKKLETHLDMITGCVEIEYKGKKDGIGINYEIWEDEKLKETSGIGVFLTEGKGFEGEFSVSLHKIFDEDLNETDSYKMVMVFESKDGSASTHHQKLQGFTKGSGYAYQSLTKQTYTHDGKETAIWGLRLGKNNAFRSSDDIETLVKEEGGLLFKVFFNSMDELEENKGE